MVVRRTSWRLEKSPLVCVRHRHMHMCTHTTFIKEITDNSTTEHTFKLHLGAIFSEDYNLGRSKMTIKSLIFFKPTKITLGLYCKLSGATKDSSFLSLP
jgi:hypothetical protein